VRTFWDILTVAIVIAGVIGFFYSWVRLIRAYGENSFHWRDWISFAALALASVVLLLRFVMPALWGIDFGVQVRIADAWTKVSVRFCALGLLLGFLGRPRLIVPITLACIGVAVFWVMSTIP
jgi:hypothetical protein